MGFSLTDVDEIGSKAGAIQPFHRLDEILRLPITDYRLIVDPA